MTGNCHVPFLGEGVAATPPPYPARMEKDAAGFPQGPTNSGRSRYLASRLPYRQHGSGRGGWNRTRSRLAVTAEANGRVNELRRKPSTSPAAYSTVD
jgi:hypothetical protein